MEEVRYGGRSCSCWCLMCYHQYLVMAFLLCFLSHSHALFVRFFTAPDPPEECPAALSTASMVAHPPAAADASDTMPGDACTDGDPDPVAELGCMIPAASGQDECEHISTPISLKPYAGYREPRLATLW